VNDKKDIEGNSRLCKVAAFSKLMDEVDSFYIT
jgi:hypothetical protein